MPKTSVESWFVIDSPIHAWTKSQNKWRVNAGYPPPNKSSLKNSPAAGSGRQQTGTWRSSSLPWERNGSAYALRFVRATAQPATNQPRARVKSQYYSFASRLTFTRKSSRRKLRPSNRGYFMFWRSSSVTCTFFSTSSQRNLIGTL